MLIILPSSKRCAWIPPGQGESAVLVATFEAGKAVRLAAKQAQHKLNSGMRSSISVFWPHLLSMAMDSLSVF